MHKRNFCLPTIAVTGALAVSACGSSDSAGGMAGMSSSSSSTSASTTPAGPPQTPASGSRNDADITFATGMMQHHAGAIQMANLATSQAANAQIKELAAKIGAAQGAEIDKLTGWLKGWNAPVPSISTQSMPGMTMGTSMPGMDPQAMAALSNARGAEFDRMWLTMMSSHHADGVAMAKTELSKGANPEAKKLAQDIIDSQSAEITQMKKLLTQLGG